MSSYNGLTIREIEFAGVSGNCLFDNCTVEKLDLDTLSGDLESDFAMTIRNETYVAGNGRCRIDVDAMSGDVTVRKGS